MKRKDENLEEMNPYQVDKLSKVPSWLIIFFIKYWAAAAAVFFMIIGGVDVGLDLSGDNGQDLAQSLAISITIVVLIALAISVLYNYVVKVVVRMIWSRRNNTFRFNMINFKGFLAYLANFGYCLVISIIMLFITLFLSKHHMVFDPFGTTGGTGIEPFTFGLYFIAIDALFILMKNLIWNAVERIKYFKQIKEA